MFLEVHLSSESLSNDSEIYGFFWRNYDFGMCKGLEESGYLWAFSAVLCFALGFPASTAVLWEMFKIHRRGTPITPNDFFILNLSIMDAVFLVSIPAELLNAFIWKRWEFEVIWNGLYALSQCGRPLLMACVCLDCYLAVVHPVTYHRSKSLTPRVVMAGVVWILTVATGITYCVYFTLYWNLLCIVPFVIAMVITGICDAFIIHTLIKSDHGRENIHPQKQRAIQTLISSLVVTVISYLPPVLLFALGNSVITDVKIFVCTVGFLITITSTLGSALMPILYLHNIGKLHCFRLGCCRRS